MRIRTINISDDVADVLRRSRTTPGSDWNRDMGLLVLPEQLEQRLYARTAKVLKALGLTWNRQLGGFPLKQSTAVELTDALDAGHVVDRKKTLELFETPIDVADMMATHAHVHLMSLDIVRPVVLEPSAGRGRLIDAFWRRWLPEPVDELIAIDIDAANCEAIKQQGIASTIVCGDFLTRHPKIMPDGSPRLTNDQLELADVILMNPPFANTADILHVTHAFRRWLAPGGILVAIMSTRFTFGADRASEGFRQTIDPKINPQIQQSYWETLPDGTFKSEGTAVNTVMLRLHKANL